MAHVTAREQVSMFCCGRRGSGSIARTAAGAPRDAVTSSTTSHSGTVTAAVDAASIRDHWA